MGAISCLTGIISFSAFGFFYSCILSSKYNTSKNFIIPKCFFGSFFVTFGIFYLLRRYSRYMPPRFLGYFDYLFGRQTLASINKESQDDFFRKLILKYGDNHPEIYRGTFQSACQYARDISRVIMVYIHSSDHQDTHKFNSTVLFNNDLIREYINEHFILWIGDVSTIEGYKLAQELVVTTYPHISIVHPNGNVISQQAGYINDLELIQMFTNLEQEPIIQGLQTDTEEQNQITMDRILREEQEQAYKDSLEADRKREE